jgi:hypothetical protein
MTDDVAERQGKIFDDIASKAGGVANLSPLDIELATLASALLVSAQDTPENLSATADTISGLLERLPTAPEGAPDDFDLARLSDSDLAELERINQVARNTQGPLWQVPDPAVERKLGPCEERGARLGRYLDLHADELRDDVGAISETRRIEIMNLAGDVGGPVNLILRNVWRPLWQSEIDAAVTAAIIATEDRLTRAVTVATSLRSETPAPAPEPDQSNVIALTGQNFPPFSF